MVEHFTEDELVELVRTVHPSRTHHRLAATALVAIRRVAELERLGSARRVAELEALVEKYREAAREGSHALWQVRPVHGFPDRHGINAAHEGLMNVLRATGPVRMAPTPDPPPAYTLTRGRRYGFLVHRYATEALFMAREKNLNLADPELVAATTTREAAHAALRMLGATEFYERPRAGDAEKTCTLRRVPGAL